MSDRLTGELVCYGRSVVHQEWPQMEDGKGGDTINPWALALFRTLKLADPKSATEQAAYGKWLDQTSDREEARRDRLHGAEGIIPTSIWLVLFLIAGVVFAFMLFFADSGEGAVSQAMLMGSATTVIVLTLAAINALDIPYRRGPGQIEPVAMERSLRVLDSARGLRQERRCRATPAALRCPPGRTARPPLRARGDRAARDGGGGDGLGGLSVGALARRAGAAAERSIAARVESTRAANVMNRQTQIDVALFTQWVDAYARDETELAAFYRKRFRASSSRRSTPGSRPSRGRIPRPAVAVRHAAVQARGQREVRPLEATGRRVLKARARFIQRADNYSLAVVLFAASLFFAGISTRLHSPRRGWSSSVSATRCSSAAVIWIVTFPVSLSV